MTFTNHEADSLTTHGDIIMASTPSTKAPASKPTTAKADESTESTDTEATEAEADRAPQPESLFEVVDELPEAAVNARSMEYHTLLCKVGREAPGKFVAIKHFHSPNGASMVRRDLQKGERAFPGNDDPDVVKANWVIESRTMDGANGRESRLFVKFIGEDIEALIEKAPYLNN